MSGLVKVGGAWKDLSGLSVNIGGTWKDVTSGSVKIAGTWKEFYAPATGDVGSYDLLQSEVLTGSAASVTFSSLSAYAADYQHLQLRIVSRMGGTGGAKSNLLRFNGVSTSSYYSHFLLGNGSNVSSFAGSGTNIFLGIGGNLATSNRFGAAVVDILDAFETTKNKVTRSLGGEAASELTLISGLWNSTSTVTSITLLPETADYQIGSRFSLYGVKKA